MTKAGRKRKAGRREPSGKLARPSKAEREAARLRREMGERAIVAAQPHRRGNLDQLCASALGRHVLDCGLIRELYDAGEEYAQTTRRWRSAKGVPVGLVSAHPGAQPDRDPEAVARLQTRLARMRGAVLSACGPDCLSALDRVALDDATLPGAIAFRTTGALAALAEHLGLTAIGNSIYRDRKVLT